MSNDNFQKIVKYFNITRKKIYIPQQIGWALGLELDFQLRPIIKYIFKIRKQSNLYNL